MSNDTAPAGAHSDAPEIITIELPRMESFAEDTAHAGRMMQAMDLAAQLTPEGFARWMEHGEAIRSAAGEVIA